MCIKIYFHIPVVYAEEVLNVHITVKVYVIIEYIIKFRLILCEVVCTHVKF